MHDSSVNRRSSFFSLKLWPNSQCASAAHTQKDGCAQSMAKRTRKSTQVCKPELAYGLAMGGQADSQVGSQVHASHKNSQLSSIYSWLAINLCRLALGGQTVKNLRRLAYEFELDQSQRKWVAKRNASRKLSLTCVDLWVRLARALHYINSSYRAAIIFNEWIWRSAFWWVISGTLPCIWNVLIFLSVAVNMLGNISKGKEKTKGWLAVCFP